MVNCRTLQSYFFARFIWWMVFTYVFGEEAWAWNTWRGSSQKSSRSGGHRLTQNPTHFAEHSIYYTAQKMKFSIEDFFSKWDQIRKNLRIWSHLLKKSLMENFIFCAVLNIRCLTGFWMHLWVAEDAGRITRMWWISKHRKSIILPTSIGRV